MLLYFIIWTVKDSRINLVFLINIFEAGAEMNQSINKTAEMTKMALLIAMNCVSAYIIIPLPFTLSPIALQTLIVNLVAFLLTPKQTFLAMTAYLLIGLAGIPVFTGGTAGPGKLFGPTGGYILGFVAAAVIISALRGNKYNFMRYALVSIGLGIPVIYLLGAMQLKFITGMDWTAVIMTGVLPFVPLDIVKCLGAAFLAGPIQRIFTK